MTDSPQFQEILRRVELARDWSTETFPVEKKNHYGLHYLVCCMIADQYKTEHRDRYDILEMLPIQVVNTLLANHLRKFNLGKPLIRTPDILDNETGDIFDVTITYQCGTDQYENKVAQCDERTKIILFGINGEIYPESKQYLTEEQIQSCQEQITKYAESIEKKGMSLADYYSRVSDTSLDLVNHGKNFEKFLEENSDLPVYIDMPKIAPDDDLLGTFKQDWVELKQLPRFRFEGKTESPWKGYLKLGDTRHIETLYTSDREICKLIQLELPLLDPRARLLSRAMRLAAEGKYGMTPYDEIRSLFGIGVKAKKRKNQETGGYRNFNYSIERKLPPSWFEEELDELCRDDDGGTLELDEMPNYNPVDAMSSDIQQSFLDQLDKTKVLHNIEKVVTTSTKILNWLDKYRDCLLIVPITTRSGDKSMFWGIIVVGPRHLKQESDKFQIMAFEILKAENPQKYPKDHFIRGHFTLDGSKEEVLFSSRVYSLSLLRVHTYTNLRRCLLPPLSVYSKLCFEKSCLAKRLCIASGDSMRIMVNGSEVDLPMKVWIRRSTALQLLMSLMNDSQLEGFFGNIRRLHMAREALMDSRRVYLPVGGLPGEKVQECLIDNPVALYLAKTWNDLPVIY